MAVVKPPQYVRTERVVQPTVARPVSLDPHVAPLGSMAGLWQPKYTATFASVLSEVSTFGEVGVKPTVISGKQNAEGRFELIHLNGTDWGSKAKAYPGTDTPQGDVRSPIAALGPWSAELMGITAKATKSMTTLGFPDAETAELSLRHANSWVKSEGKPTFGYQPLEVGLVDGDALAALSLRTRPGYEVAFPFGVRDAKLRPHEAAYHFGVMAFIDQPLGRRIRNVTQVYVDFANVLDARPASPSVKRELETISQAIRSIRSGELDSGLANGFSSALDSLRFNAPAAPLLVKAITNLTHSEYTPGEALVRQLRTIIEPRSVGPLALNPSKLTRLLLDPKVLGEALVDGALPRTTDIETSQTFSQDTLEAVRQTLYALDRSFEKNQRRGTFELMSPERFANNLLAALPERLSLLAEALRATANSTP